MDTTKIKALISLLDDPDEQIYSQIKAELIGMGDIIIPELENAWEYDGFGHLFQNRIEEIVHSIQFYAVRDDFADWAANSSFDLLQGLLLINQYQYPDYDDQKILTYIEQIRKDAWLELNENLTAMEKVKVLNHIFFELHGFAGNTKSFHAPQNSFLTDMIETKKGNPISLGTLYMVVAQQLQIPVYGVNLPNHFVMAYMDEHDNPFASKHGVLFYINAFSRGVIFNDVEIEKFLTQVKAEHEDRYFKPSSNKEIVSRVLSNLIYAYDKLGYVDKIEELKELKDLLK